MFVWIESSLYGLFDCLRICLCVPALASLRDCFVCVIGLLVCVMVSCVGWLIVCVFVCVRLLDRLFVCKLERVSGRCVCLWCGLFVSKFVASMIVGLIC